MFQASGMDKDGLSTFIECGSCAPERQPGTKDSQNAIRISLSDRKVFDLDNKIVPGITEITSNLLHRQQKIIEGKIPHVNKGNLIGVNIRPSRTTADSVPYLTHLDFTKSVRELNDIADYVVLNLADDVKSSGVQQYYQNSQSLDKLLKGVQKARVNELGKLAALEYEKLIESS